jgi:ATP-binding cassette subfamily B protein
MTASQGPKTEEPTPEVEVPLSRIATLVRASRMVATAARGSLVLVATVQISSGLLGGGLLYASGRVIAGLTGEEADWSATWPWIAALAGITTLIGVMQAVGNEQQRLISELVNMHTSERLIASSADVPFSRFDSSRFYDRMRRATEGSRGSATSIVWGTLGTTRTVIDMAVIVGLLVVIAPVVIPIALAAYVPLFLMSRRSNATLHRFTWDQTEDDRRRDYLARIFGDRRTAREVRMFDLGHWFGQEHSALWASRMIRLRRVIWSRVNNALFGSLVSSLMTAGALGLVAYLASSGDLTLADAGVGILGVHRLSGAVTRLNSHTASLHQGGLHMLDYDRFIADAERERESQQGLDVPSQVSEIVFHDVSFYYPGSETAALDGVNLRMRRGEVLALVGPNGSGKSTLMMLMCGLYEPSSGEVQWDGVDIALFDPVQLRAAIAPMFQDFTRYQLTARENIAVSDLAHIDDAARVSSALETAGAQPVLDRLGDGLQTRLSRAYTDGTELSAGQWQRLAVARALFHGGPLLVLDEPSADLDALAERILIDELIRRSADRCVLFISHRFSAVRRANRIVVLNQGSVVETGSHNDLVAEHGLYATMFHSQTGED